MRSKRIKTAIVALLLLAMLITPLASAQAGSWTDYVTGILKDAACATPLAILNLEGCVLPPLLSIVGTMVSWSAALLNWLLGASQALAAPDIIRSSWVIFRDFVNMFFILALIIMAFGTIFNVKNYTFKELFPRFLFSALLINFSLEIGVYVLRVANGLASVFLATIGDVGARLADGLLITKIASPEGLSGTAAAALKGVASGPGTAITMLAFLVFLIIILGTFLAASIFILARIVVIWFLLIVSPVAWFGYTLPSLRAETWSKWWKAFISWSFFLPTYLFFIMFASILLSAKKTVGLTVGGYDNTLAAGDYAKAFFEVIGLTDLLFFILVIIVLLGGIAASFKIGGLAANGAGAVMSFAHGRVKALPIFPTKGAGGKWVGRSIGDW